MQKNIGNGSFFLFTLARKQYIIPSLTLLKIKNAHKERGCALCEHFLFGFNVCYIFFTVILIFLSSLSLLA